MLFPKVSLEDWLKAHPELTVQVRECEGCGSEIRSLTPFVEKHYFGLISEPCKCGKGRYRCMSMVTRTSEENNKWSALSVCVLDRAGKSY